MFLDVLGCLAEAVSTGRRDRLPRVIGGRYRLSSKEFTPGMTAEVFAELGRQDPRPRFTVGIHDDVTQLSLDHTPLNVEPEGTLSAVFFGMGSDGTVGANKNTIKILGATRHAQAYFVYDSKKSGSQTVSHLSFGSTPIAVPHQVWDALPAPVQQQIIDRDLRLYAIDADRVAREAGMLGRINTVLQTCYFAVARVLPVEEAIERIKESVRTTYGKRGPEVVARNLAAIDSALANLHRIDVPAQVTSTHGLDHPVGPDAQEFVQNVTAEMMAGRGELLPVSVLPVDGTYPSGTTKYEKRNLSSVVAAWDAGACIQCGNRAFVCPQLQESELEAQRNRLDDLHEQLDTLSGPAVDDLRSIADHLLRRSVWLVGGDGWAYDIGYGGLDHVLSSGRDVNILVLDTEVYSNTGGQASKSTPLGSVAKFASGGKTSAKKDMAMLAIAYGHVYVARVAMGADPQQTLQAFQEPVLRASGRNPFLLDSHRPRIGLSEYRDGELRFRQLAAVQPQEAKRLTSLAEEAADLRWQTYEEMTSWAPGTSTPTPGPRWRAAPNTDPGRTVPRGPIVRRRRQVGSGR